MLFAVIDTICITSIFYEQMIVYCAFDTKKKDSSFLSMKDTNNRAVISFGSIQVVNL